MNLINSKNFIGYIYDIDFEKIWINVVDKLKEENNGLALNTLLIIGVNKKKDDSPLKEQYLLVRLGNVTSGPDKIGNINRLMSYYKTISENANHNLDLKTRAALDSTNYECNILGTIFKEGEKYKLGSDVSNFMSPFNYSVYKPEKDELDNIIKITGDLLGKDDLEKYGVIRYASSLFDRKETTPFYINPDDVLARRTALFGMTRTGKSNSIKKLIQTIEQMNGKEIETKGKNGEKIKEKRIIGQIVFDVNGEYANTNVQDGTSIYEKYKNKVSRYSFVEKDGFKIMKVNFHDNREGGLQEGFQLIKILMRDSTQNADYFQNFLSIELEEPEATDKIGSAWTRYNRLIALYRVMLFKAGFKTNESKIKIKLSEDLKKSLGIPSVQREFTFDEAVDLFESIWDTYDTNNYFKKYKTEHNGKEWADENMKSLLMMLTGSKSPGGAKNSVSGYRKIIRLKDYHTSETGGLYSTNILTDLKRGNIVLVDLSMGEDEIKKLYSEKLTTAIFNHNKTQFTSGEKPSYFQLYFEEAHNLFPKTDTDLTQIYNRLAKEGAKYRIGLTYATQEVSSISSSILKNTENWFISHLNNDTELNTLNGYYDFSDYSISLKRFSSSTDKGYSRIKMLSYPYTLPVQIDLFE